MILYVAIMLIGVFIAAAAQVLLKKSSQIKYSSKIREYLLLCFQVFEFCQ